MFFQLPDLRRAHECALKLTEAITAEGADGAAVSLEEAAFLSAVFKKFEE